jgi:hypothetical protein
MNPPTDKKRNSRGLSKFIWEEIRSLFAIATFSGLLLYLFYVATYWSLALATIGGGVVAFGIFHLWKNEKEKREEEKDKRYLVAILCCALFGIPVAYYQINGRISTDQPPTDIRRKPTSDPVTARMISVKFIEEIDNVGQTASVRFNQDGYILFATTPDRGSFSYGIENGGNPIQRLPFYVGTIRPAQGTYTFSDSKFALIADPRAPAERIRTGTVGTHARAGESVPLVDIEIAANAPSEIYIGYMTNMNGSNPEDYPTTISITSGSDRAMVHPRQGETPTGQIDVFFFRVAGAQAGDHIIVSASQSKANRLGGRYNPSVSGLFFSRSNP